MTTAAREAGTMPPSPRRETIASASTAGAVLTADALQLRMQLTHPGLLQAAHDVCEVGSDLTSWVEQALIVGATALHSSGVGVHRAELQAQVDRAIAGVHAASESSRQRLETALTELLNPDTGPLSQASQAAVTRLSEGVRGMLSGPEAVLPQRVQLAITEATAAVTADWQRSVAQQAEQLRGVVEADRTALSRAVTAALAEQGERLAGAIGQVHAAVLAREQIAKASQPAPQALGLAYEHNAVDEMLRIAGAAGDRGDHVGLLTGTIPASKIGDGLIDVIAGTGPAGTQRVVVEAKLRERRLSTSAWADLLDQARVNRAAVVALGMTTLAQMPVPGHAITVIDAAGIVVAYDPDTPSVEQTERLRTVYLLLKLTAATSRVGSGTLDPQSTAAIRRDIEALLMALEPINKIAKAAGAARRAVDTIASSATSVLAELTEQINQLLTQLD